MGRRHTFAEWMTAVRPWSFPASVMPVVVTLSYLFCEGYDICWGFGIWALVNMVLFHCAGNTWSDWSDFRKQVDAGDTYGARTITSGMFSVGEIRRLSIVLLAVSSLCGIVLVFLTGLPLLWIGLAGVACAVLYPPLKYVAAGDMVIMLAFGILPSLGTSFVTVGEVVWGVLWPAVPVSLITVAILHINNLRDISTDSRAGISTFAMKIGWKKSVMVYNFEVIFPFFWVLSCVLGKIFPWWTLLVFLAAFPALLNVRTAIRYRAEGTSAITGLDEGTAKLQMIFSLALSLAFVIAGLLNR